MKPDFYVINLFNTDLLFAFTVIVRRAFDDVSTTLCSTVKDCQLINNMADSVDQPLHTAAAVTEVHTAVLLITFLELL